MICVTDDLRHERYMTIVVIRLKKGAAAARPVELLGEGGGELYAAKINDGK